MVQRWLKTLVFFTISAMLVTACQKNDYSKDEPLKPKHTPSLFIGSQNQYLYALVPETGEKKWETNMKANIIASPVVVDEFLMVAAADSLYKLDLHTGAIIKSYSFDNENFISFTGTPVAQGKVLYVASQNGFLYAVDVQNDKLLWKYNAGNPIVSSPTLYNGQIIITSKKVHSVNALNGTVAWTSTVESNSGATVSYPYVYVCGIDGAMYALDITSGITSWTFDPGTKSTILSSPLVYGGNIIFGSSDFKVYCIDSVAKIPRWVFETSDRVISSPYAKDQIVYFGSYDYNFYAVDIIDGDLKWKKQTGELIKSSPLVYEGTVYVGSFDKTIYAFDTSGDLRWKKNIDGLIETSPVLYDLDKAYYSSVTGFY